MSKKVALVLTTGKTDLKYVQYWETIKKVSEYFSNELGSPTILSEPFQVREDMIEYAIFSVICGSCDGHDILEGNGPMSYFEYIRQRVHEHNYEMIFEYVDAITSDPDIERMLEVTDVGRNEDRLTSIIHALTCIAAAYVELILDGLLVDGKNIKDISVRGESGIEIRSFKESVVFGYVDEFFSPRYSTYLVMT